MSFEVLEFRKQFPLLECKVDGKKIIYFDNGASTLKHAAVTERVNGYNRFEVSNVHRGAHTLSQRGTENYEAARSKVQKFIGAKSSEEIIFTRGTTEGINLVANTLGLSEGDEILLTPFEHHSNIVPWQLIGERLGCKIKVIPFDKEKGVTEENFLKSLTDKTKVCSFIWYSNSFGNRLPVEKIVEECKKRNIITLVDAAQTPLSEKMNVEKLDVDFLTFSGHKMFAPYGIGVLFGKKSLLEKLSPYQGGGSMIDRVSFEKTTFADVPQKFEAGTPNVSGAIGLGKAVDVISEMDFEEQHSYVLSLRNKLKQGLESISWCQVYEFESTDHAGVLSFNVDGAHSSDIGTLLDRFGIAVRTGHHCTQPLMDLVGISGTIRASFAAFNTEQEIDYFLRTMEKIKGFF